MDRNTYPNIYKKETRMNTDTYMVMGEYVDRKENTDTQANI